MNEEAFCMLCDMLQWYGLPRVAHCECGHYCLCDTDNAFLRECGIQPQHIGYNPIA
jgi:hypothetical protein